MKTSALRLLETPAALIDLERMRRNIARMQHRATELGVHFRPHVKTSKCPHVQQEQADAGATGITVSTLKEAKEFFAAGVTDILYAVCMAESKLPAALALRRAGCRLTIVTDSLESAQAIVAFGREQQEAFEVLIEIDTDGHRGGVMPDKATLLTIARVLHDGGMALRGVMTHAGSSYEYDTPGALVAVAVLERDGIVKAALRLRGAGLPCPVVSVGSTPTALMAPSLDGVTELRAGVYVFFDLVMHNVGVCGVEDIALSVLTTVIGHQHEKGWVIVDAGWMAMSRDRGTSNQKHDFGYGQVCDLDGNIQAEYVMSGANQEHGLISKVGAIEATIGERFPIGTRLRILPNHACSTGAQFTEYHAMAMDGTTVAWPRFGGW